MWRRVTRFTTSKKGQSSHRFVLTLHFLEQFAVQFGLERNLNEFASIFIQVTTYPREEWRRHYASLVQVPLHGCRPWLCHGFIRGSAQVLKQSRVISAVEHYLGFAVYGRLQEDDISIIAYNSLNREEIKEI